MAVDVIGVMIPIVAIVGVLGFAAFRHWTRHCERMEELRQRNLERAAESDRALLSYDSDLQSAHLTAILERLNSIERRLGEMDGNRRQGGAATTPTGRGEGAVEQTDRRQRQTQQH
jgi:hypothetical protein